MRMMTRSRKRKEAEMVRHHGGGVASDVDVNSGNTGNYDAPPSNGISHASKGTAYHRDCEGSTRRRRRYSLDNAEQNRPVIVFCLGYKLGDVDISKQRCRSARKATKMHKIEKAIQISDFDNLKLVKPIWRGTFKVNKEVLKEKNINIDAYLSSGACQKVKKDISRSSLLQVVELEKVPRLEVWLEKWKSSGPTDACIGLFFFTPSLRPTQVLNRLVDNLIENDSALKATVGITDLLIFPSSLLPEKDQFYRGEHYLWGVFKLEEGISDEAVIVGDKDDGQLQEQHLPDQQEEVQRVSSGQEPSAVELVGNQPLVEEVNPETEKEATAISMTGGVATLPGSSLSHAKPSTPTGESNSSLVHPEEVSLQQEEDFTSSPKPNATTVAESSAEEGGRGQPSSSSVSEPPTIKLFGKIISQTPRAQQQLIIAQAPSEGSHVFPVPEEMVAMDYNTCNSAGVGAGLNPEEMVAMDYSTGNSAEVGAGLNPAMDHQLLPREIPEAFDLNGRGGEPEPPQPDVEASSRACPELARARGAEASNSNSEVDLELRLGWVAMPPSCILQL